MRHQRIFTVVLIALTLVLCTISNVSAFPPLPSSFYGAVQQGGQNIPNGTLVEALIEGEVMAYTLSETYQGTSVYALDIPGDDTTTDEVEGGTPDQIITFRVGGVLADQTAQWTSGVNQELELTIQAQKKLSPTLPTFTPAPSQTPIPKATLIPTRTHTQTAGTESVEEDSTAAHSSIHTATGLPTHTITESIQLTQAQYLPGTNGPAENSPENSPKSTALAAAPSDEKNAVSDPAILMGEDDQSIAKKNFTTLWIALPLLLLIGALAILLAMRHKKASGEDSSLL